MKLFVSASFTLGALVSCAGGNTAGPPPRAPASAARSPATATSPAAVIDPVKEAAIGAFVERLLGGWVGAGDSPFGEMPFAALFEREADGSVRSWVDDGEGTKIDLRLHRTQGRWLLTESASLPGVGTQTHTLVPVALDGDRLVLHDQDRPDFLSIELRLTTSPSPGAGAAPDPAAAQELHLSAKLRGEDHVAFTMKRLPDQALPHMRSRIHPPGTAPAVP
jgi:hypothetical protein